MQEKIECPICGSKVINTLELSAWGYLYGIPHFIQSCTNEKCDGYVESKTKTFNLFDNKNYYQNNKKEALCKK